MELPAVVVLDVNETLSDMRPMADRFAGLGVPGELADAWFAAVLRDGFALSVHGVGAPFAEVAADHARRVLGGTRSGSDVDAAVEHVMGGFTSLGVHEDVPDGLRALSGLGIRLVTLSNGSASVAERLLGAAGLRDLVELVLTVEDAGVWKPAPAAYAHALERTGVAAQEAMLVAVHPWDTDGAARAGLRSAWVDRTGAGWPGHFRRPELTASSLLDLADRLGA